MGVFEILFIALFILLPLLEQVMKRGQKGGEEPGPTAPGREGRRPEPMETEPGEVSPRSGGREPVKASDMVPDDLWAVLTGEERPREGIEVEEEARPAAGAPRSEPPQTEAPAPWEEAWTPRPEPRGWSDDVEEAAEPESLEHYGPEAYSLETFEREPTSLEAPLASPDVRHRRFHETIERPRPRRAARRSRAGRALRSPASVRQAFVLSEILGTPKGLE